MMQIHAILLDSIRELRSRSLFWISASIAALVALLLFALIRFDQNGWGLLWFDTYPHDALKAGSFAAQQLLSWLFGGAFVYWWLSWGAIIVALISTASIMPDFIASGSIDLAVSKPIGRVKLFLTKVLGATMFMLLQVTIGVLLAYLLMGLRFGMWFHTALWAIPLLTLQFLYLYSVSALAGVLTRSPLASLLIVMIFWALISTLQFANNQVNLSVAQAENQMQIHQERIDAIQQRAAEQNRSLSAKERRAIQTNYRQMGAPQQTITTIRPWQKYINRATLFVPKTGDVQKIIADQVDAPTFQELLLALGGFDAEAIAAISEMQEEQAQQLKDAEQAGIEAARTLRRQAYKSLASSLAFTCVVLGLATFLFVRRDF